MATVSIRELSREASRVVEEVRAAGTTTLVTKHGTPVAALVPIKDNEIENFILAKYLEDRGIIEEAEREISAGETISAEDAAAELDEE